MVLPILLTGCSILTELVAPVANFGLGLYNADTYVTKDCKWYEKVNFSKSTKDWIRGQAEVPQYVIDDLKQIAYNNDLYDELCNE